MAEAIAVLPDTMRRRIRNQDHHLARVLSPLQIAALRHRRRHGLGPVSTSRRIQALEESLDIADFRGEVLDAREVRDVLWRVVPVGDHRELQGRGSGKGL